MGLLYMMEVYSVQHTRLIAFMYNVKRDILNSNCVRTWYTCEQEQHDADRSDAFALSSAGPHLHIAP